MVVTQGTFAGARGEIAYHRWAGDAPPSVVVLVVHGYAEHGARYGHLAEALVAGGAVVYANDHQGHGRSAGRWAYLDDFETVVDDLESMAAVAEAGAPGRPLVMLGHSMGGLLTARFAQRNPGRLAGAGFLGAVLGDWAWAREVTSLAELPPSDSDPEGMSRDPAACAAYAEDPLVYHGTYHRELLVAEVACIDRCTAALGEITVPVLCLHGDADPFVPPADTVAAIFAMGSPDREVHVYPGARHELVNETNKDQVIATIAGFVARVTP